MSFKSTQKKIAGQGHSMESAGAILANASRHASEAAKRKNPKLNRVKGKMHSGGIIGSSGLYGMQKGETVMPASVKSGDARTVPTTMMGARPALHAGGEVPGTGTYEMQEGEHVLPAQHKSQGASNGSVDCGDSCVEQLPPAPGGSPVRMRHNKAEGGSLTTSEVRPVLPNPNSSRDAEKVKCFTRGGCDRVEYPGVSGRDWNQEGHDAPNTRKQ